MKSSILRVGVWAHQLLPLCSAFLVCVETSWRSRHFWSAKGWGSMRRRVSIAYKAEINFQISISTSFTAFLLSLTFSDLLFCAIMMPMQAIRYYHRQWTFGDFLCQVFPFVFYSNVCVSMLSMILMTINRYILITFQHLYPKIYQQRFIILQLFCAWFISFLIMVSETDTHILSLLSIVENVHI